MPTRVLREITPLGEHDFMYVADRHKKEFDYPIHQHEIFELNFVMGLGTYYEPRSGACVGTEWCPDGRYPRGNRAV